MPIIPRPGAPGKQTFCSRGQRLGISDMPAIEARPSELSYTIQIGFPSCEGLSCRCDLAPDQHVDRPFVLEEPRGTQELPVFPGRGRAHLPRPDPSKRGARRELAGPARGRPLRPAARARRRSSPTARGGYGEEGCERRPAAPAGKPRSEGPLGVHRLEGPRHEALPLVEPHPPSGERSAQQPLGRAPEALQCWYAKAYGERCVTPRHWIRRRRAPPDRGTSPRAASRYRESKTSSASSRSRR